MFLFIIASMNILDLIKSMKAGMQSVIKSLKAENHEEAIEALEKTATELSKAEEEATKAQDHPEVAEDATTDETDADDAEPETEDNDGEEVQKTTETLTKTQEDAIKKYVDMYISWDSLGKIIEALKSYDGDITDLFKTVEANKEALEKMSKVKSKQVAKTTPEDKKDIRGGAFD